MSFLITGDEEAGVSGPEEGTPLLPLPVASAPAPILNDTRISIEESDKTQTSVLSESDAPGLAVASDAAEASDSSSAPVESGDSSDIPEDWRTLGLLATVSPNNSDEIVRLRGLVDTRLHEAARAQDLATLRALLAAGAAAAALDWAGRTPLHVCVVERLIEPLKVLLSVPGSADVCDASGWPLLHAALLHGWQDGARAVLDAGASVAPKCEYGMKHIYSAFNRYPNIEQREFSFSFILLPINIVMESGDMEMFEEILTVAKRDGVLDSLNGFGRTALCTAIQKHNLPIVQVLLRSGASPHKVSDQNETALHVAVHDPTILKYLLENTDVTSSLDDNGLDPLHDAVCAKNPESVRLLLDRFKNARVKTDPEEYTPLHYAAYRASNEVAEVILEKDRQAMDVVNKDGDTPLHAAAKHNNRGLAALLLRKGATLSTKDKEGVTVLELISNNFYESANFFDLVFDGFIYNKKFFNDFEVHVDYRVLTNGNDMSQINVLETFVRCGRSKALIHPLIESLLYLKWRHFLPIFYGMICICALFLASFNILIINIFYYRDMHSSSIDSNSTFNASPTSGGEMPGSDEGDEFHGGVYWLLVVLTYFSILLLLVQETLFIYLKRLRYFASVESWVKLSGLLMCAIAPLAALAQGPWPRHVACAALLLAWLQAMFLVSRFPRWGYYVLMFGKVIVNMLKIFVTSMFLVIGFSFCFMIQYHSTPPFDGPFSAFVKTLVMMSSEFDYEDLFGEDHDEQLQDTKTVVRVVFVMFVIFLAIVLMNFMIGVAVSDINDLNETGNIRRLEKQVELLSTFDALVYDSALAKFFQNTFVDRRYHKTMYTFRGNKTTWYAKCRQHNTTQNDDFEYSIQINSSSLYNAIVETASKSAQQDEKNIKDKTFGCKIDALYDAIVDRPIAIDDKDDESKKNGKDSIWLRQVITKQNEQIKMLIDNLTKMSHEIEGIKLSNQELNSKINRLTSNRDQGGSRLATTRLKSDKVDKFRVGTQSTEY